MPNIREQEVTKDGIRIVASDGREVRITRAKIAAEFQASKLATTEERKVAVADVVKALIVEALGAEQVAPDELEFDFDPADARKAPVVEVRTKVVEYVPPVRDMSIERPEGIVRPVRVKADDSVRRVR